MKRKVFALAMTALFATMTFQAHAEDGVQKPEVVNGKGAPKELKDVAKPKGPKVIAKKSGNSEKAVVPKNEFEATLNQIYPMSPKQVKQFSTATDQQFRAKTETPGVTGSPVTRSLRVSSAPGTTPPVLRLGRGFVTTLVFVDSSGQNWPVTGISVGNPSKFDVEAAEEGETNVLTVSPLGSYIHSNLAVMLKGRQTPVLFTVVSDQRELDFRLDVSLDERGPNAKAPVISGDTNYSLDDNLRTALDGIKPKNSIELKVTGIDGQAWAVGNNKVLLRTKATLMSPAWSAHAVSADGTSVYAIPNVPVLIAFDNGNQVDVKVEGLKWQNKKQ